MPLQPLRQQRLEDALRRRLSSVVVVVEAVRRRHNTSAILRSAEAFGVHEVHLVTDDFRPARGAARGAERWLELHRHHHLAPCVAGLRARGFRIVVADFTEDAWTPDSVPLDAPLAVLFGSELTGVSDEARALADGTVLVPMRGLTASLNVSVAAACILHRVTERKRETIDGEGDLEPERLEAFRRSWIDREELTDRGLTARVGEP